MALLEHVKSWEMTPPLHNQEHGHPAYFSNALFSTPPIKTSYESTYEKSMCSIGPAGYPVFARRPVLANRTTHAFPKFQAESSCQEKDLQSEDTMCFPRVWGPFGGHHRVSSSVFSKFCLASGLVVTGRCPAMTHLKSTKVCLVNLSF